jgi:hypothetical protein
MGLLFAAKTAQAAATTSTTTEKHERSISRWRSFLSSIGLQHDFFLDNFSASKKHQILSAFMEAIRSNRFSRNQKNRPTNIKAESCSAAMGHLAQAFTAADRPDPRFTRDGKLAVILRQQIKGYMNLDPSKQPQQALPINILLYLLFQLFQLLKKHPQNYLLELSSLQCTLVSTAKFIENAKQNF